MTVTLAAREFLLAGGRITFAEWQELNGEQQATLAEAGETLMQEQADLIVDSLAERVIEYIEHKKLEEAAEKVA